MLDVREFRRACYEAARRTRGSVTEFRLAECVTPSFHQAVIAYFDRTVAVVCDRGSPLLAVAEPRVIEFGGAVECGPLTFVDFPELVTALQDTTRFNVLTKAELDGPFHEEDWPDITPYDIRYWRPATVGEALFNYWD